MQKLCPIDETVLLEMQKNGVTIDVCPECKGVWLDRGELEKLLQVARDLEREYGEPERSKPPEYDRPRTGEYDRPRAAEYDRPREPYRRDDDDDDHRYGKKKKSALGRIFDIFD